MTEENVKTKMYTLACEMGREGEWETERGGQPPKSVFLGQIVLRNQRMYTSLHQTMHTRHRAYVFCHCSCWPDINNNIMFSQRN